MNSVLPSVRITDLRHDVAAASRPSFGILEDASGARLLLVRRAGRVVGSLFLLWVLALALGGLGLLPTANIPFARALTPSATPAPLPKSDVGAARHAAAATAAAAPVTRAQHAGSTTQGPSATISRPPKAAESHAVRPSSSSHGNSLLAPGHIKAPPTQGNSSLAPGQSTTPATKPGLGGGPSGTAPAYGSNKPSKTVTGRRRPAG